MRPTGRDQPIPGLIPLRPSRRAACAVVCSGRLLAVISITFESESLVRRWTSTFDKIVPLDVEDATRTGHVELLDSPTVFS